MIINIPNCAPLEIDDAFYEARPYAAAYGLATPEISEVTLLLSDSEFVGIDLSVLEELPEGMGGFALPADIKKFAIFNYTTETGWAAGESDESGNDDAALVILFVLVFMAISLPLLYSNHNIYYIDPETETKSDKILFLNNESNAKVAIPMEIIEIFTNFIRKCYRDTSLSLNSTLLLEKLRTIPYIPIGLFLDKYIPTNKVLAMLAGDFGEELKNNKAMSVQANLCKNNTNLKSINLSNVTTINLNAFEGCINLNNIHLPNLQTISDYTFKNCSSLTEVVFPKVTEIGNYAFENCSQLKLIDFKESVEFSDTSLANATGLQVLILRNSKMSTVPSNNSTFGNTPIASGQGFIYVPSDILNSYKQNSNWNKKWSSVFRPLENYTIDGTLDGAFDWSKI